MRGLKEVEAHLEVSCSAVLLAAVGFTPLRFAFLETHAGDEGGPDDGKDRMMAATP